MGSLYCITQWKGHCAPRRRHRGAPGWCVLLDLSTLGDTNLPSWSTTTKERVCGLGVSSPKIDTGKAARAACPTPSLLLTLDS